MRTFSKIKGRDLFKVGDRVIFKKQYSRNDWYIEGHQMIVTLDESSMEFSGVFIDYIIRPLSNDDCVQFKSNTDEMVFGYPINYNNYNNNNDLLILDKNSNIHPISLGDIIGLNIKEYIIELDNDYYTKQNREELIKELLQ